LALKSKLEPLLKKNEELKKEVHELSKEAEKKDVILFCLVKKSIESLG